MRVLLVFLLLMLLAVIVQAETVLALYADTDHEQYCVSFMDNVEVGFWYVEFYLMAKPPVEGVRYFIFKFVREYPLIFNGIGMGFGIPEEFLEYGSCAFYSGVTIFSGDCLMGDWVVGPIMSFGIWKSEDADPGPYYLGLGAHNTKGVCGFEICHNERGHYVQADIVQGLYINYETCPASVGVKASSWGAIKGLFRER